MAAGWLAMTQATKGYYYSLEKADPIDEMEIVFDDGSAAPAEYVLFINTYSTGSEDHHGDAQDALEPIFEKALGRTCLEESECQFFLAEGEAAKLEPELIKAGWQKGQW
jgi:hypothetical protein